MRLHVSRRDALLGAGAAVAALSMRTPALADPTVVHVSTVGIFGAAPFYAADAQGYFSAENLAVTTEAVQSGAVGVPALAIGQFDILYANTVSTISAIDHSIDLRIVFGGGTNGPKPPGNSALMKRRGDALRTGRDLEGKVVGVNGVNGINWVLTRSWVKMTGGDPDKVKFLELPNAALIAAIKADRIDAAYVVDPFMTIGSTDPALESFAWPQSSVFAGGQNGLWVAMGQTVAQRPELVRAFVGAMRKGVTWINANLGSDSYNKLVAGFTKIDPSLLAKMQMVPFGMTVTAAQIQPMVRLMRENGLLTADIDLRPRMFN
jgi:NitT/TauT family transport system substrate-binding protein